MQYRWNAYRVIKIPSVFLLQAYYDVINTRAVQLTAYRYYSPTESFIYVTSSTESAQVSYRNSPIESHYMMTSSNGKILRVTGLCAGNSPVTGDFSSQRPVTQSFDVYFDLRLNKRLSKQSWGWWFETLSRSSWRHRNENLPTNIHNRLSVFLSPKFPLSHWSAMCNIVLRSSSTYHPCSS